MTTEVMSKFIGTQIYVPVQLEGVTKTHAIVTINGNMVFTPLNEVKVHVDKFSLIPDVPDGLLTTDYKPPKEKVDENTLQRLKDIIYMEYNVTEKEMRENVKSRLAKYRIPRQIVMYFWRELNSYKNKAGETIHTKSLAEVASIYNKDHATLLHTIKTVNNQIETDKYFRQKMKKLNEIIRAENEN